MMPLFILIIIPQIIQQSLINTPFSIFAAVYFICYSFLEILQISPQRINNCLIGWPGKRCTRQKVSLVSAHKGKTRETAEQFLYFLPCQKNPNDRPCKDHRRQSDKYPFKYMKSHSYNGSFRIMIIPAQVRTI